MPRDDRGKALEILGEGMANGARARELTTLLSVGLTTLQRWWQQFAGVGDGVDSRKGRRRHSAHRLSDEERNGSCSLAMSLNSQRCHLVKSCLCWLIAGFMSVGIASFAGC